MKVTKKSDISDFYFNLQKNIAFGAENAVKSREPPKQLQSEEQEKHSEVRELEKHEESANADTSNNSQSSKQSNLPSQSAKMVEEHPEEDFLVSNKTTPSDVSPPSLHDKTSVQEQPKHGQGEQQPKRDHHKRSEDAVTAAKERFLARKRAKDV